MNKFLQEFHERGYFYQCTDNNGLSRTLEDKKIKAYIGFDCTAESLHVGSLLQIMCLRLLQKHGHQPIVLLGGGLQELVIHLEKTKPDKFWKKKLSKIILKILKKF